MRVDTTSKLNRANSNSKVKKNKSSQVDFSGYLNKAEQGGDVEQQAPLSSVDSIDTILSLQGTDPEKRKKQTIVKSAEKLIHELDQLRKSILANNVSLSDIKRIQTRLSEIEDTVNDPKLMDIVNDIKLRAEVELAKVELSKNK